MNLYSLINSCDLADFAFYALPYCSYVTKHKHKNPTQCTRELKKQQNISAIHAERLQDLSKRLDACQALKGFISHCF